MTTRIPYRMFGSLIRWYGQLDRNPSIPRSGVMKSGAVVARSVFTVLIVMSAGWAAEVEGQQAWFVRDFSSLDSRPGLLVEETSDGGYVAVRYNSPIVYKLKETRAQTEQDFASVWYQSPSGERQTPRAGFFDTGDAPAALRFESGDHNILEISEGITGRGLSYEFKQPGTVSLLISVGEDDFTVPIEVREIDLEMRGHAGLLIERYGFPDEEQTVTVCWPNTRRVDNIVYAPSASEGCRSRRHWSWDSLPFAVIVVQRDDRVFRVGSYVPDSSW
jgi:hypothetical protein